MALVLAACGGAASGGPSSGGTSLGGASPDAGTGASPGGACAVCGGSCVDTASDPHHCGACDNVCAARLVCDRGACGMPACLVQGPPCPNDHVCCGDACCPPWEMCCAALDAGAPSCVSVEAGACPSACAGPDAGPSCP